MFLENKASKSNLAVKEDNIELIEVDLVSYDQDLSMCSLGSVPLLERWHILEWATHPLERWRPPTL
jgi:hypothetical protein